MSEKTYQRIIQLGVVASLFFVFFVFKGLLFPFITSKQFAFNILIEMILAIWLIFILKFPKYRPKKSYITYGLIAYFVAIFLSIFVSVDPNLSFWGDAERMLGFFHLFHFFLLYLFIISCFRSWSDFKVLFFSSALVATTVSLIGIFGENTFSVIGNTAYVSGYIIFNIFFVLILFFREKERVWRFLYLIPIFIMLWEFWLCRTSGAIIGLFASILLFFFLLGVFHDQKRIKRLALGTFIVAIIAVLLIFSQQQQVWFQNSFLKNLTSQKVTFQTRLISWKSAAKDFKNHPVFGTGFGTYAITFDRHFDSKFFDYTITETYFDRAHNNLIDIGSTTGLVGLISYLSIFIAALFYLYQELKANDFKAGLEEGKHLRNLEILLLLSLLAAYFIQNLAIFDSYVTYIALMMTLGFIYHLRRERLRQEEITSQGKSYLNNIGAEVVLLIVFLFSSYLLAMNLNVKPQKTLENVIEGYAQVLSNDFPQGFKTFQASLKDHPLERDARVVVLNLFNSNYQELEKMDKEEAEKIIELVVSLARKNVEYNSQDNLMQMQLAQILDIVARYYGNDDIEKFNLYSREAMQAMEAALEASPGRAPVYLTKAQMQLNRGETEEAIETINYSISLNPNYYEGYCRLAQFYLFLEIEEGLGEAINSCVDLGGDRYINSSSFLTSAIGYLVNSSGITEGLEEINEENIERSLVLALRLVELYPQDADVFLNTAKLYLFLGENEKSAEYLRQAYRLDKEGVIPTEWEDFLAWFNLSAESLETID